jgi:hypothetical protein
MATSTHLTNTDTLANQVENYKKVFAKVNVIASEDHVEGFLRQCRTTRGSYFFRSGRVAFFRTIERVTE